MGVRRTTLFRCEVGNCGGLPGCRRSRGQGMRDFASKHTVQLLWVCGAGGGQEKSVEGSPRQSATGRGDSFIGSVVGVYTIKLLDLFGGVHTIKQLKVMERYHDRRFCIRGEGGGGRGD
jgi:hypothetical protein